MEEEKGEEAEKEEAEEQKEDEEEDWKDMNSTISCGKSEVWDRFLQCPKTRQDVGIADDT